MQGKAVSGKFNGTDLNTLEAEKMSWADWKAKHPNTLVWSQAGREDLMQVAFEKMNDSKGYRGLVATDKRLSTKDPVFGFIHHDEAIAVSFRSFVDGASFRLADGELFLFRASDDPVERSTVAFFSESGFEQIGGRWREIDSKSLFEPNVRTFVDKNSPEEVSRVKRFSRGFDTWWYNWSLNNPGTKLLLPK